MVGHGEFFDKLEVRSPAARTRAQMARLRKQIALAKTTTAHWGGLLAEIDPAAIRRASDLAALPITRKSDIAARQKDAPPFAGLVAYPMAKLARVYQSPGPIYEVEHHAIDTHRFARAMWAAGLRPGELVHNTFSYHLTPAGMLVETAAHAIGCPVFPAGVGNTELQLQAMAHLRPVAYGGTPSFLKILLDKARETGTDVSSLKKALVGGEALPPSLRKEINDHGVFVLSSYGTAELGLIAYETPAFEGMVIDEGAFVEIVRPGTGDPVPEGEVGEVVVTLLNNPAMPLVRYATGDLSAFMQGPSPCGRTNQRIKGWMGRADQTTKVKGMFVTPGQIAEVVKRYPQVLKARLVVDNHNNADSMVLNVEIDKFDESLKAALAESLQAVCKLRGTVTFAAPGSLPNDGRVIADIRKYE